MREADWGTIPTYALAAVLLEDPEALDRASRVARQHDDYEFGQWVVRELFDYLEDLPSCWQRDCIFQLLLEDQEVYWHELHERLIGALAERDKRGG